MVFHIIFFLIPQRKLWLQNLISSQTLHPLFAILALATLFQDLLEFALEKSQQQVLHGPTMLLKLEIGDGQIQGDEEVSLFANLQHSSNPKLQYCRH